MEALLVLVPFAASLLTFFSGFGLGTLLTPVFVLFFPVDLALLMTASVHLMNNVLKFGLLIRSVERKTLFSFALWAVPGAFIGARATVGLGQMSAWHFSEAWTVGPLPFLIGCLMITFTLMEFWPAWNRFAWTGRWFYAGGFFSGFFGGLSGHQGALRSLFLKKLDLSPMSFVATGTAIALLIDLSRIPIYWQDFWYGGLAMETRTSRFCLGHLWCSVGQAYVEEGPVGTDAAAGRPLPALDGHRTDRWKNQLNSVAGNRKPPCRMSYF